MSLDEAVDCAVIHLVKDYGFPIDNVAANLATFHGIRCFKSNILLKDYGFSFDESSVNVAGFQASLCDRGEATFLNSRLLLLCARETFFFFLGGRGGKGGEGVDVE